LVEPIGPGRSAIYADDRALVGAENHTVGMVGSNPDDVMIFAARRSAKREKSLAVVVRAITACLHHVDNVWLIRVHVNFAEITAAKYARIIRGRVPGGAGIVRTIEPLIEYGQHAFARGARNHCNADPSSTVLRQTGSRRHNPGRPFILRNQDA